MRKPLLLLLIGNASDYCDSSFHQNHAFNSKNCFLRSNEAQKCFWCIYFLEKGFDEIAENQMFSVDC